jgi:hypothetical protein
MRKICYLLALFALFSCSNDDSVNNNTSDIPISKLKINEVAAKGSTLPNEFGLSDDWFEIYNPTESDIVIPKNTIYFSDDFDVLGKFLLPIDTVIKAKGYMMVWCDDSATVKTQIHTNFKLSKDGDNAIIYYKKDNLAFIVDQISFGSAADNKSYGRTVDGGDIWSYMVPTPGAPNQGSK